MDHAGPDLPDENHLHLIQLYTRACVHMLNNYLAGVSGYQQLLAMKLEQGMPSDTQPLLGYLKEMEASLREVEKTLRDLSTWARPKAPALKPVRLYQQLGEILDTFCEGYPDAASRLERDIPDSFPPVRADQALLQKLLDAVLDNAVRATSKSQGIINLSLTRNPATGEEQSVFEQSIRVRDQGCGIHPTRMRYLRMPILAGHQDFAEPSEGWQGSGFGLPMAFSFASQMGGKLSVDSRPGEGTTVTLALPESQTTEQEFPTSGQDQ